jgi:isopenicillin N synthase-like dioxygenase
MESDLKIELKTHGFATVDYPPHLTLKVAEMMDVWQKFCSLPLKTKSAFVYTGDYGTGYEYKDEIGETKDRKENFHFILKDVPRLEQVAKDNGVEDTFVSRSKELVDLMEVSVLDFSKKIEELFDVAGFLDEVRESKDFWLLRYLHYFPTGQPEKIIAAHHCDKFGITMYLSETTSGVEYYNNEGKWISMPVLSGKTIITPDLQLQYKTLGELKALYHRVVANEKAAQEGRYSIVCFIPFRKTPFTNKERIGRMQDMPLAFNYGMSFEEFSKLFTS